MSLKPPILSESRLQANCYQWAYNSNPIIRGLIFSVPNGGYRNLREAQTLKATGLTPGIPDLILLYNGVHAFEFKLKTGKLSKEQEKIHITWKQNGINVYIIKDEDYFKEVILSIVDT